MKKKQVSEDDFDFFNVSSELKKVNEKRIDEQEKETKKKIPESKQGRVEARGSTQKTIKKTLERPKKTSASKSKKTKTKIDGLFEIEEIEKDPFKTVQVRTSLWQEAEKVSKKIEEKTGKKYSATKVLNRILEDYFKG